MPLSVAPRVMSLPGLLAEHVVVGSRLRSSIVEAHLSLAFTGQFLGTSEPGFDFFFDELPLGSPSFQFGVAAADLALLLPVGSSRRSRSLSD